MRANRTFEIFTGLFVLLGFAALFFLTTQLPSNGFRFTAGNPTYTVTAQFGNVGDLKPGAPVTLAGVRIGDVESIHIDPASFRAVVTMRIEKKYDQIPDDSGASIDTQGLLGGQYIAISAGGSPTFLKNGSQILLTQSAIVIENLLNKLFANFASRGSSSGAPASSSNSSATPPAQKEPTR